MIASTIMGVNLTDGNSPQLLLALQREPVGTSKLATRRSRLIFDRVQSLGFGLTSQKGVWITVQTEEACFPFIAWAGQRAGREHGVAHSLTLVMEGT